MVKMEITLYEPSAHPWREEGDENKPEGKGIC